MAPKKAIRLPGPSDHIVVCGQTGSGKSQAAMWLLSRRDITTRPWIAIDHKDDPDDLINGIEKAVIISYNDKLPSKPGIYILKCGQDDTEEITEFLWRVYRQRNIGLYFDEAMMMGQNNKAFNTILTQGRSLQIPCMILTQRPVKVSPWAFSEAKFWWVFNLVKKRDRETVADDVPISSDYDLPRYHSYYYDVGERQLTPLGPVPDGDTILAEIDARLPKQKRFL